MKFLASSRFKILFGLTTVVAFSAACNGPSYQSAVNAANPYSNSQIFPSNPSPSNPGNPTQTSTSNDPLTPPANRPARNYSTDALLFTGDGTWGTEVTALKALMQDHGMSFHEVNSSQMNAMSVDQMASYGMFIFPGGAGGTQAGSLTSNTHQNIREAVQVRGVGYLGFCAGSFIAVGPTPRSGQDVSYGLGVVNGQYLDYYYLENQGTDIAMTMTTFADGSKRDLLWYGGPVVTNVPGTVVAKYPTGDAAISEMWSGNGFVILSGPHPAAPQSVKDSFGLKDSDSSDTDLAWNLLSSTLKQAPLPAFKN